LEARQYASISERCWSDSGSDMERASIAVGFQNSPTAVSLVIDASGENLKIL
jgi:hypothetical protein